MSTNVRVFFITKHILKALKPILAVPPPYTVETVYKDLPWESAEKINKDRGVTTYNLYIMIKLKKVLENKTTPFIC